MPAPTFLSPPGRPTAITETQQVDELAGWILDDTRHRPVLVVTARDGDDEPYFPVRAVQGLVGTDADVVAVAQIGRGRLTRALARALPDGMMVFGGAARIYWPLYDAGRDPENHALIRADIDGTTRAERQARLADRWHRGPDHRTAGAGAGVGEELPLAITRAWLATVPDVERAFFPLRPYTVDPDLAEQLAILEPAREPVARLAAQIVSGRVWAQPGPAPERLLDGERPRVRDQDHAVAWRAAIPGSDRYLYYWQPATGPIELARIGTGAPTAPDPKPAPTTEPQPATPEPPDPAPPKIKVARAPRQGASPLASDEALLRVLRASGQSLGVAEIRGALNIDPDTPRKRLSAFLKDATDRGIVIRTGQTRATRYSAPT